MLAESYPFESARPGVSIKINFSCDYLQFKSLLVTSLVSDSLLELIVNSSFLPHSVLRSELLPEPVNPITITFFNYALISNLSFR